MVDKKKETVADFLRVRKNLTVEGTLTVPDITVSDDLTLADDLTVAGTINANGGLVTDTIAEETSAAGVTADGVLLKDGGITLANATAILTDIISEKVAAAGVTVDSLLIKDGGFVAAGVTDLNGLKLIVDADADTSITADTDDQIDFEIAGADDFRMTANTFTALSGSTIAANTIAETTAASGVTIDSLLIKDGTVRDGTATSASFVIGAETGGDEITVNIQLLDAAGADMAIRSSVGFYLSSDANGDAIVAATTSLVGGTDGNMQEFISNSAGRLVSEADGDIDVVIGSAGGAATYYLVLVMPNGKLVVSTAITFA